MQGLKYAIFCVAAILWSMPNQVSAKKYFIPKLPKSSTFHRHPMTEDQEISSLPENPLEDIPLTPEEQLLLTILEQENQDKNNQKSQDEIETNNNQEKEDENLEKNKIKKPSKKKKQQPSKKETLKRPRSSPLTLPITNQENGTKRHQCFPVEYLPSELQVVATYLLSSALQSDALYTLVGGIKPLSILSSEAIDHQLSQLNQDEIEQVFEVLTIGKEISFVLNEQSKRYSPKQENSPNCPFYIIYIIHSGATQKCIQEIQEQIRGLNLAPNLSPKTLVKKVHETLDPRGPAAPLLGYSSSENSYSHSIKKTHQNSTQKINAYYKNQIDPQIAHLGALEAVRNWFDNGNGFCSTTEAYRKVLENVAPLQSGI